MTTHGTERRKNPRLSLGVSARVQIVFPEITFTPLVLTGSLRDISRTGARVNIHDLGSKDYSQLIRGPRLCRVIFAFPDQDSSTRLFGKILNFEIRGKISDGSCILGIVFGENGAEDLKRLNAYLDHAAQEHFDIAKLLE